MSKQIKLWFTLFPFSHQTIQGVFLISWFIAWLFLPTKQVKIFNVIYYIMPIPCNNMVNSIKNANIRGSCGNQTDPRFRLQI